MSNNTSTSSPRTSDPPASPTTSVPSLTNSPTNPPTTAQPPDTSSPPPGTTSLSPVTTEPTSPPPPPATTTPSNPDTPTTPATTSTPPTTSAPPPTTSTPPTTSRPPTTTPTTPTTTSRSPTAVLTNSPAVTTIVRTSVVTPTKSGESSSTFIVTITTTSTPDPAGVTSSTSSTSSSGAALDPAGSSSSGSLSNNGRIAIGVVVPIVGVALLVGAGIFFWRRRKARKDLEEQRRKEVEDYAYNPNADPTIPGVVGGAAAAGGAYEMREDGTAGYRGWGSTTLASSTGRKASTTMSGGAAGVAYSDGASPTHGAISDTRSGEPLMTMTDGSHSPEGEILGAMGPSASNNRSADVHRGPSNASSSYSAAARSDGSGEGGIGVAYGSGGPGFYDQYPANGNPYTEGGAVPARQGPAELGGGQPVIRDVTARRNTRIENPAHYPQQSAGISQNF